MKARNVNGSWSKIDNIFLFPYCEKCFLSERVSSEGDGGLSSPEDESSSISLFLMTCILLR